MDRKLVFRRPNGTLSDLTARMYADASWGSDPDTSKSFSGYLLQLDRSSVCWSSKRQSCVAKSTCEAEYIACSHATSHLIWIKSALTELQIQPSIELATDNQSAIHLASDHRINTRSKHIAIYFHFVRERLQQKEFSIIHIPSADNLPDIYTKALSFSLLQALILRIFGG